MKSTSYSIGTQNMKNTLSKLDEVNKASTGQVEVDETHMLLVSLSTCVMLAKQKPLDKEYYQWTRGYMQSVRDESGRNLPNIKQFIKKIEVFEKSHKIEDELQNEEVEDLGTSSLEEFPKMNDPGDNNLSTSIDAMNFLNTPAAQSTPLPPKVQQSPIITVTASTIVGSNPTSQTSSVTSLTPTIP